MFKILKFIEYHFFCFVVPFSRVFSIDFKDYSACFLYKYLKIDQRDLSRPWGSRSSMSATCFKNLSTYLSCSYIFLSCSGSAQIYLSNSKYSMNQIILLALGNCCIKLTSFILVKNCSCVALKSLILSITFSFLAPT